MLLWQTIASISCTLSSCCSYVQGSVDQCHLLFLVAIDEWCSEMFVMQLPVDSSIAHLTLSWHIHAHISKIVFQNWFHMSDDLVQETSTLERSCKCVAFSLYKCLILTLVMQLRDILQTYNRVTELCFRRCASNFNYRSLTSAEVCAIWTQIPTSPWLNY